MADDPDAVTLPGIAALPPATANQIGSGQVLVDPSSVVKELIDNALDARAKSIFVDITANTIDSIQVKDDGHGIPAEDRVLVCRRYCTSKIRDLHDLRDVGGKWLGFRGEALSSMAEMSGTLSITTRVEGEPVAVKLKYGRNGELSSTERESHPVGTTVKVNSFFEHIPVRKQTAVKISAKWLARIRHLMQAYALARPSIRFRLHVLKAKNTKGDFVYAPKANSNVEDAVLKVVGKDCALQCDWTVFEKDGFEVHAFLPKPTATGAKIANQGAYISVDSRPVSTSRGTMKKVAAAFKNRLSKSNISLGSVRDPFFCMNIICPPDSYDPNIEPAKDDVLFEDESLVVSVVDKMLEAFYPEAARGEPDFEPPTSAQSHQETQLDETIRDQTPVSIYEDARECQSDDTLVETRQKQPRWRSSMYGIDEEDLEFLQENRPPIVEEEEGLRDAAISNPWTIARMNTSIKPKKFTDNGQLPSPAKSQGINLPESSSPLPAKPPILPLSSDPLTPQTLSRRIPLRSALDIELEQSIQPLNSIPSGEHAITGARLHAAEYGGQPIILSPEPKAIRAAQPRRQQRKQPTYTNKPFAPPVQKSNNTWFGQPMRGPQPLEPPRRQKRSKKQALPLFPSNTLPNADSGGAEDMIENGLYSENNTDIRSFFGGARRPQNSHLNEPVLSSSFTPINQLFHQADIRGRPNPRNTQEETPFDGDSRAASAEPYPRSKHVRDQPMEFFGSDRNAESLDMAAQFRAYAAREGPPRPSSVGSTIPIEFNHRSDNIRSPLRQHRTNDARLEPCNVSQQFETSQDGTLPLLRSPNFLKKHQELSTAQSKDPTHQTELSLEPHSQPSKFRRPRRRTTDALERTRSAKLPLERVPHEYRIQDIFLPLEISLPCIIQVSRKFDMRRNSLEWGYPADEAYDVFAEHVVERTIMDWVIRLDDILRERYGQMDGADTRCTLHEGIQKGLDERKEQEGAMKSIEIISIVDDESDSDGGTVGEDRGSTMQNPVDDGVLKTSTAMHPAINYASPHPHGGQTVTNTKPNGIDEDMSDFDISQFVDLDAGTTEERSVGTGPEHADAEDYDGDIEDEMLMGL